MKKAGLNLAVFLAGIVTIAVAVNCLAAHPALRWRLDATKTRAYSLSEQTRRLLAQLDGEWTIALIMSREGREPALLRQVDEVLQRYDDASESVSIARIDPADPASLDRYEALLARLRLVYRDQIAAYDAALSDAREALELFTVFLQQQAGGMTALRAALEAGGAAQREIDQVLAVVSLRLEQTRQVEAEVARAMRVDESRPMPDYDSARSILVVAMTTWADELYRIVGLFNGWRDEPDTDLAVRQYAATHRDELDGWAQELATRADPLKHLPALELARIGRSLETGETAIVLGPPGAAVIPPEQLFARLNLRQRGSGEVTFDQRFRGEQTISATIRSLVAEAMPMVVLVHGEEDSLLNRRPQNIDFVGAADMLNAVRYEVREWIVHRSERPDPPRERPVAWVVVPPPIPQRRSLAVGEAEQTLIEAVRSLIADGESVLLNVSPSGLARSGKTDPWSNLGAPFGLTVDTSGVVFEAVRDQQGGVINQRVIQLSDYAPGHAIASAVHGLQSSFDLPVAVRRAPEMPADVRVDVIAAIESTASRWLEPDWMVNPESLDEPAASQRFHTDLPLVVAAERRNPTGEGVQRLLVVGSGGWLLSYLADVVIPVGGDRRILVNPGNYEMLLAAVAWLAGADELIAASPISRQVARLEGVTDSVQTLWRWIALAIVPGGCLGLGLAVWMVRRS